MASGDGTGRVWVVTGASSGFGRSIVEAATARGDTVVATGRRAEPLEELARGRDDVVPLVHDVTRIDQAERLVADVLARTGRIDVLVNNAGHGQVGAVEETTDAELRAIFDVHLFGPVALTRAVLPVLRRQGGGAIVQISSFGGQVAYPGFGAYCATKFALEGLSEALAAEVAPFGVRVLIVEPGAFRTSFSGAGLHQSQAMPEYAATVGATRAFITGIDGSQPGDPARAASAILEVLDADEAPLRLPLGDDAVDGIRDHLARVGDDLRRWEAVSRATAFADEPAER